MANNSGSTPEPETNTTVIRTDLEKGIETAVLVILMVVGIVANSVVIRRTRCVSRFAPQNAYLFFGLSFSDFLLCVIRVPALMYVILLNDSSKSKTACLVWAFSNVFLFIDITTNMILAVERRVIIVTFHRYLAFFTPKIVLRTNIAMWCILTVVCLGFFVGFGQEAVLHIGHKTCLLKPIVFVEYVSVAVNGSFIFIFGLIPIVVIVFSYGSIVSRIYRANLLKIDRFEEKATYKRLVNVSLWRVFMTVVCWPPVLICTAVWPLFPGMHLDFPYARLIEYIAILQSIISPFITMNDTDFRETTAGRRRRFCSTIKSRSSDGWYVRNFGKRRLRRTISMNVYATSQDMKSYGNSAEAQKSALQSESPLEQ